jgi:succinate dehydrogenase / fumarate reductase, membrane anchor subunit
MKEKIGAKRLVVGAHHGFADWLMQRITAVIMALYTIVLLGLFLTSEQYDYQHWAGLFANPVFKIITFITLMSLFFHAWVGVRDIWMDYIKPLSIRVILHVLTALWLIGCTIYAALILMRL